VIRGGHLEERALLEALAAATGARTVGGSPALARRVGEEAPLWNSGFVVLEGSGLRRLVAGGPDLPPDLGQFVGDRAGRYEWVLVSPLRDQAGPSRAALEADAAGGWSGSGAERRLLQVLEEAVMNGDADLHFERHGGVLRIRAHGPGGMRQLGEWGPPAAMESLRLLKRWANFSTAENPLPQDGRVRAPGAGRRLAFRASHIAGVNGESMVLRATGAGDALPALEELGTGRELARVLERCVRLERGLVLFTGATGSGKTTTMCSLLRGLEGQPWKILTIEDPVEHELPGATQSAVNELTGWTFAAALRAFLRQDPDIIMVGEMRDRESAAIACRAGLTGHCVLSSLHARSVVEALDRLHAWGIAAGALAESLRMVVHQRLVADPASGGWRARFAWLKPLPEETHAYLATGRRPARWDGASLAADQDPRCRSA
jgi:Tfp pilus assembly pilus retraction ATPase PilT